MSQYVPDDVAPSRLLAKARMFSYVRIALVALVAVADGGAIDIFGGDGARTNIPLIIWMQGGFALVLMLLLFCEERYFTRATYLGVGEYWQRVATRDSLTGLHNRLAFMQHLSHRIEQSRNGNTRFALLFVDLNKFKAINDTYGHGAGDTVLTVSARRLKKSVGRDDFVARLGGDEFAVILNNVNIRTAQETADAINLALRTPMQVGGIMLPVSASVGMQFNTAGYDDADTLLHEADVAMYRRKASERWSRNVAVNASRLRGVKRSVTRS